MARVKLFSSPPSIRLDALMRPKGLLKLTESQNKALEAMQIIMQLPLAISLLSLLFTLALSSIVHISPTLNQNRASDVRLHKNATSRPSLSATRIRCNGAIYRRGLEERSCISALEQMDDDLEYLSFGTRGGPVHFQVELPQRWISGRFHLLSGSRSQEICSQFAV